MSLQQTFEQNKDRRYIMFGGKGGLGKTTFSAATAFWLAQHGHKVLVFSVDPQASLSDIFQKDIQAASAEPAMEESAIFDAVVDIVVGGEYDYYIYDLVPLGHALYYLSMAKVYDEWINRITKLREEMREHEEMVARIKRQKSTEEDHILSELNYIKNRINQSSSILTDKQKTAFFFVVVPEEMIILDTEKAAQLFSKFDVPIAGYVVNRVLPSNLTGQAIPPYLQNRLKMQGRYLEEIDNTFGSQVIARVPELERDVTGLPMIEKLAGLMYANGRH
jgi:arsenite/tail-anchored protein-transporting ATPase